MVRLSRPLWLAVLLLVVSAAPAVAERPVFRISVENRPSHVQARAVARFAQAMQERLGERFEIRFYHSAALYRDRDVLAALKEGKVEMAVPGTWHVARHVPDVGLFLLPAFYGRDSRANHAVVDGSVGKTLDRRIEAALHVAVPGPWLDLGHANLYLTHTRLTSLEEVEGLRIRVAGGKANEMRLEAFGALAVTIPWPDFPAWLSRGAVDGVLTTSETIRSARLWERGIRYAFMDREYFPMYVPMISSRFFNRIDKATQQEIALLWAETADWERAEAARAQTAATEALRAAGVAVVEPDEADILRWRERLMGSQREMVEKLDVDPELYHQAIGIMNE